jgi:2-polyprenyl-3-methyl-5-hydroxy-6-metoxy-1,4-benzoquinol methylase
MAQEHKNDSPPISGADAVTSKLWGEAAREKSEDADWSRRYWQSNPLTVRHINRLLTGGEADDWLAFTKRRFFPKTVERGLSLGCGHGPVERDAIAIGLCERFDAFDISEEALEVARREAEQAGVGDRIDYRQADLNTVRLEPAAYDAVFAIQVLHHVDALEHLLDQVAGSMRPGGLLVVNEYVGPARFQLLDKTQTLANRILDLLPDEYKVNPRDGVVRQKVERASPEDVARVDPSESIRSDEIPELLRSRFDVRYQADFGGTILQFLLADIVANFDGQNPKDVALLDLICLFEEVLITERVLPSDFAYYVLSPRQ